MKRCLPCQSFFFSVVNPLFFPLSNDRCDGLFRIKTTAFNFFQNKNCHHTFFHLDVLKTIPNLSSSADRPKEEYETKLKLPEGWEGSNQNILY